MITLNVLANDCVTVLFEDDIHDACSWHQFKITLFKVDAIESSATAVYISVFLDKTLYL